MNLVRDLLGMVASFDALILWVTWKKKLEKFFGRVAV
jgi:hypothetical protein